MIHLDTSLLIDALTGARHSAGALRRTIEQGDRVTVSAIALYEWLRGPRLSEEINAQQGLLPAEGAIAFGPDEAVLAAKLYRSLPGTRQRVADLAIAACALSHDAALWTLNTDDFRDIPGLRLYDPRG